jgi:hypothetical protein
LDIEALIADLRVCNLPSEARAYLIASLETAGTEQPDLDTRDEWIKTAIQLCPGETLTAKCAYFLECLDGEQRHPSPIAARLLNKLASANLQIPHSIRQLKRVFRGSRQDVEAENVRLCPLWPRPDTAVKRPEDS